MTEPSNSLYSKFPFPNHPSHIVGTKEYAERFLSSWNRPLTLLILGCGTGEEVLGLMEALPCLTQVTAIEPCEESYQIALKNIVGSKIKLENKTIESFEQESSGKTFDLIWCSGVLHHTAFPDRNLSSVRRMIKKNGQLVLGMYHHARWKTIIDLSDERYSSAQIQDTINHPIEITLSWSDYLIFIKKGGFKIKRVHQKFILPPPPPLKLTTRIYDAMWNLRKIQMMSVLCVPR